MSYDTSARLDITNRLSEIFRDYGYEGASLSRLSAASGLRKSSLYYHFPGGKEEMAEAVLDHVAEWYGENLFKPLRSPGPPKARIEAMLKVIERHYRTGGMVCLFGAFALGVTRDRFASKISNMFASWIACLGAALADADIPRDEAVRRAADTVMAIQGALTLSRALGDSGPFRRVMRGLPDKLLADCG